MWASHSDSVLEWWSPDAQTADPMAAMTAVWTVEMSVVLTAEKMDGTRVVQWAEMTVDLWAATTVGRWAETKVARRAFHSAETKDAKSAAPWAA